MRKGYFLDKIPKWTWILFITLLAATLPPMFSTSYSKHLLVMLCIYLVLTLSYNMIVGFTGYLTLAHTTFFGIGAYASAIITVRFGGHYLVGILVGLLLTGVISLVFGYILFSRIKGFVFSIVTLGLAITVYVLALNWLSLTGGPVGIPGIPRPNVSIGSLNFTFVTPTDFFYLGLGIVVGVYLLSRWIGTSRYGLALFGIRENEQLVESVGVNSLKFKIFIFVIASMVASIAGSFFAHYFTLVSPEILWTFWIIGLITMIIVGGAGSNELGVILGTIILVITPEFLRAAQEFRQLIYGITLLLMIIFVPQGIGGLIERRIYQRRLSQWRSSRLKK
jgi:branched-chain amino acid transport system permease protein